MRDYLRDGGEIYRRSFATIRAESDLSRFSPDEARVVVRLIHACGMVEAAASGEVFGGVFHGCQPGFARRVSDPVRCHDGGPGHHPKASAGGERNHLHVAGSEGRADGRGVGEHPVGHGPGPVGRSAPRRAGGDRQCTDALFHLLELLDGGAPWPAAIIGMPVGFVGAAESKLALFEDGRVPCAIVAGRLGGSAMAAATVNALAQVRE